MFHDGPGMQPELPCHWEVSFFPADYKLSVAHSGAVPNIKIRDLDIFRRKVAGQTSTFCRPSRVFKTPTQRSILQTIWHLRRKETMRTFIGVIRGGIASEV